MPHLRTLQGFGLLTKYVTNWPSVLAVYFHFKKSTEAKFRNGELIMVSSTDFGSFYESLYRKHNESHGIMYTESDQDQVVATFPNGLKLKLDPNDNYSHGLDEVFVMKVYGSPDLQNQVAIDIGAAIGDTAIYFASLGAEVFAYEPDPKRYQLALQNVALNGFVDRIHLFNESVTGGTGPRSLKQVIEKIQSSRIFLKMDCEGCEHDVLLNSDDKVFDRIFECRMEYHGSAGSLVKKLRDAGFKVSIKKEILTATRIR